MVATNKADESAGVTPPHASHPPEIRSKNLQDVAARTRTGTPSDSLEEMRRRKDAAYEERNCVVAVLSKLWPSHLAHHPTDDLTWDREWMTIVCIHSPVGQLTWHVHDSQRDLFAHLADGDSHWDGHTTEEKYQRLAAFPALARLPRGDAQP